MADPQNLETDVLIVGAGPVGLLAANALVEKSIDMYICDKLNAPVEELRASTFHPPTLDLLEPLGLTSAVLENGLKSPEWQIRFHETGDRVVFDLSVLKADTNHPYRVQCEQAHLAASARAKLGSAGIEVNYGCQVEEIVDKGAFVETTLVNRGVRFKIRSRYLIGADGAQSIVRGYVTSTFPGHTYPETTILATTDFPFENHLEGLSNINYVWWEKGTFSLLKLPDLWRCSLYPDSEETLEEALEEAAIRRKLSRITPEAAACNINVIRPYRVHMKITDEFCRNRIVLAGDAAHLNSPSGGMGMNGGIHDALMLSDALELSLRANDETALPRYAAARRATALEDILQAADRNRSRMQEKEPGKRRDIFNKLKTITEQTETARSYLLKTSMIEGLRKSEAQFRETAKI
ncbi:MAG: FAD-dependent oxidoreductase [Candidatus Micropelagos thuwalensis]